MNERIPAHLEVSGLIRAVQAAGGFATVLAKGERDAGTLLVVCCQSGADARLWERMPHPDGISSWTLTRQADPGDPFSFAEYCERRHRQDPDNWIVELDIVDAERFIGQ